MDGNGIDFLNTLDEVIRQRLEDGGNSSYTAKLAAEGKLRVAQKVGEEAVECVLAAATGSRDEQVGEAADLLYHLMVLLNCNGIGLADVVAELEGRHRRD